MCYWNYWNYRSERAANRQNKQGIAKKATPCLRFIKKMCNFARSC